MSTNNVQQLLNHLINKSRLVFDVSSEVDDLLSNYSLDCILENLALIGNETKGDDYTYQSFLTDSIFSKLQDEGRANFFNSPVMEVFRQRLESQEPLVRSRALGFFDQIGAVSEADRVRRLLQASVVDDPLIVGDIVRYLCSYDLFDEESAKALLLPSHHFTRWAAVEYVPYSLQVHSTAAKVVWSALLDDLHPKVREEAHAIKIQVDEKGEGVFLFPHIPDLKKGDRNIPTYSNFKSFTSYYLGERARYSIDTLYVLEGYAERNELSFKKGVEPVVCPCCGYKTLRPPPGSVGFCTVCGWKNDLMQLCYPTFAGHPNDCSLKEAQERYAAAPRPIQKVTYSKKPIKKDPQWYPIINWDGPVAPNELVPVSDLLRDFKQPYYWLTTGKRSGR